MNLTPEEMTALEAKIEREVGDMLDRVIAAVEGHGDTPFSRVVVVRAVAACYEQLLHEDPDYALMFGKTAMQSVNLVTERVVAKLMTACRAAIQKRQN